MTFDQVLQFIRDPKIQRILADDGATDFQKAADIHAMLGEEPGPKPERKARKIKPAPTPGDANGHGEGLI